MPDNEHNPVLWGSPQGTGSAFDFRSKFGCVFRTPAVLSISSSAILRASVLTLTAGDVITTPSQGMLLAIARTTLHDDVYGEDLTTRTFEEEMAKICGHESAAFVLSGTMANQLALRSLLHQPPHAILADASAHIIHWEAGGIAHLSGAVTQGIRPQNRLYITLDDVKKHAVITDDVHKCPTRVISIENTCSGVVVPLEELQRTKEWASAHGIAVHMDGARLWEAVSVGAGGLDDFGRCCDVLTLDFSKNLGAPMGAMVLGPSELVGRLRRLRKSIGGGMRQAGVLVAAARQAVVENFGLGPRDCRGVLETSRTMAEEVGRMWVMRGGTVLKPIETNMVWLDLGRCGIQTSQWNEIGRRHGIKLDGKRVVLHHQISELAMKRLGAVMDEVLGRIGHPLVSGAVPKARL
ncbi:Putative aromatic amino acid beta-eliminating lyase/threonine aldolase [Colletotrichum destructivum]|uniref:Aromatic amino acid beta-eliminating lyase/threonine aldolase n=1 Tax=Colletotrichum destructivum TaxID=34406 RepID=A0AAX4I3F6_9PEZI|nr:Putative aromatic amino acid beta-eliminating lyase/threonine aldolase [Colletotrichum destructivum]